ncbi:FKBP-type peptidyl-prolyl cis-trans isomerase [Marinobacterium jannaschii]|uniref:FKBP-type peptidyl-prolyl cis-trans isomerase n=1 Tax=Marinobacterium jannaschii TaxID=64970 RepID=UPI0004851AB5|nr:peptidylprolyl isomerase [Marinobacterium jannaschii]
MKISDNKVVSFNYLLQNAAGETLDSTEGAAPLPYLHGHKNIIPALEAALTDHTVGDRLKIELSAEQGYGERDEDLVQNLGRSQFDNGEALEVGMMFQMADEDENIRVATIIAIEADKITIDANHPLAGESLVYDIEIAEVREATAEEIQNGRVELP